MKREDKIIGYYVEFNRMYFPKDVFQRPLALSKALKTKCMFCYGFANDVVDLPTEHDTVVMKCLSEKKDNWRFLLKLVRVLLREGKHCKGLVTFHLTKTILLLSYVYKFINPSGVLWVTADMDIRLVRQMVQTDFFARKGLSGWLKQKLYDGFFKRVDLFSVETQECYDVIKPLFERHGWRLPVCTPCGINEEALSCVPVRDPLTKENIILSVGRFGTYQKNTEMLLEGLAQTDLHDWKVYLVGPVVEGFSMNSTNNDFQAYLKNFYNAHPSLREKIIFTGPVFDIKALNTYFSRAKLFVMTSRFEGFGNVYGQALWYRCHIVSTEVGGAKDMSAAWKYGTKVAQEDSVDLANKLTRLIQDQRQITYPTAEFASTISYKYIVGQLLKNCME